MLTKSEFLASLRNEVRITAHIGSKLTADQLAFRFSPGQRSNQELLEYLTVQLASSVGFFITGSWDLWGVNEAKAKGVTPAGFAAAMDAQFAAVERLLAPFDDFRFETKLIRHWSGAQMTLSEACAEYTLKFAVAYKMQLFLQAKAAGQTGLNSSNLWKGKD